MGRIKTVLDTPEEEIPSLIHSVFLKLLNEKDFHNEYSSDEWLSLYVNGECKFSHEGLLIMTLDDVLGLFNTEKCNDTR